MADEILYLRCDPPFEGFPSGVKRSGIMWEKILSHMVYASGQSTSGNGMTDMFILRGVGSGTPAIRSAASQKKKVGTVILEGEKNNKLTFRLTFREVVVAGYQPGAGRGDKGEATEEVYLSFTNQDYESFETRSSGNSFGHHFLKESGLG